MTEASLGHVTLRGPVRELCCGDGAMSRVLTEAGHAILSSGIHDRAFGTPGVHFLERAAETVSGAPSLRRYFAEAPNSLVRYGGSDQSSAASPCLGQFRALSSVDEPGYVAHVALDSASMVVDGRAEALSPLRRYAHEGIRER